MLVLGSENIDLVYGVDHIVRAGETISSTGLKRSAGGKGANQSAALGKAGMPVFFAGKIGRDGVWILDLLRSFGVDVSLTVIRDDVDTGQAIIQVDADGQNSIILTPGGNKAFTEDEIDSILSSFGEGSEYLSRDCTSRLKEIEDEIEQERRQREERENRISRYQYGKE